GHGKTTLFRLLLGQEQPDAGQIIIPKNYRIGYVRQELRFSRATALEEGRTALPLQEADHFWKVEKILAGLGFAPTDFHRPPAEFSGGYQVRLNLAKALISEPDLLLLDEPTNFLDITSIRWIERFLSNWPHELMLITHDRSFMDQLVTHTMGIHRRKVRKIAGDTEKYYTQMAQDEEVYEKTRINDERRRKEIEQFITRFRAKARLANLVQSRIKTLAKMEKKEKLERIKNLEFSFRSRPLAAKQVLSARNVTFAYDNRKPLIRNFNVFIGARDRVCVVGPNGKGKTTLLKLLAEVLAPQEGQIIYHPAVVTGFFEQTNVKSLVDTRTVEEEILDAGPHVDRQLARNICGAMLFPGQDALKKVSVLSGGEKSRVMLGKLLLTPVNLLLLDEPTNHLDMEACDALLAALDNFDGTVIMVTHNEMFLHALAQRLIVFQNETLEVFEGGYQDFLEKGGWQDEIANSVREPNQSQDSEAALKLTKKELRRRRSEVIAQRARVLKPLEKQNMQIENEIDVHEKKLNHLNQSMQQASQAQDGPRIAELSQAIHACQSSIDRLFEQLEKITDDLEAHKRVF
ncbi:MAG: ABC-F family ATP-binding cassette domain-containing protein, partial [Desulfobacterales bacterium]